MTSKAGEDSFTLESAGPEFRELATNELRPADQPPTDNGAPQADETGPERRRASAMFTGPTQYGIAAVSGSLLIRTGSHVFCVRATTPEKFSVTREH